MYTACEMRVLGIDCGGEYTGFGTVEQDGAGKLMAIHYGAVKLNNREPLPVRLAKIYDALRAEIAQHRPERVAVEDVFYSTNVKTALKLGHVRGVAMVAAASCGLAVEEYAPTVIKSAVVGYGRAEKHQVQMMVARLLGLAEVPQPADAADALAIAICHLHTAATKAKWAAK